MGRHRVQITYFFRMYIGSRTPSGIGLGSGSRLRRMRRFLGLARELWIEISGGSLANSGIAQRTLGDVSYSRSRSVGGVGDYPCLVPTLGDLRETSVPRIDRFPPTRPPWRVGQYRELKKLIFLAPSKCSIPLCGPVANGRILKRLHAHCENLVCLSRLARARAAFSRLRAAAAISWLK